MASFSDAIQTARSGQDLGEEQTADLIDQMLRGDADDDSIGSLLLALSAKGEAVDELVGAATAMRRHMTRIEHDHTVLLDTCGTGGSCSGTFNISTAVAIVTAACGVAVAKHGNRAATSRSGSADVLEQLGVAIESEPAAVSKRLSETGLCFCFAPKLHPAMKYVVAVRRKLGVKTLFNLLGPLCNPAAATHQLLGTSSPANQTIVAAAIARLGTTRSFVIHADDGQDEISLASPNTILDVRSEPSGGENGRQDPSQNSTTRHRVTAADFHLDPASLDSLSAADPADSAAIIRRILSGQPGPCRDTVVAGTATALWLAGKEDSLVEAIRMAADAIDSGAAQVLLGQLSQS